MSNVTDGPEPWDIEAARRLYNIRRWGAQYFDINEAGHVVARPLLDAGVAVDLTDVVEEAKARGLKLPLLIRNPFPRHSPAPRRSDQSRLPEVDR